jgi:hypothetical protein
LHDAASAALAVRLHRIIRGRKHMFDVLSIQDVAAATAFVLTFGIGMIVGLLS